MIDNETKKKLLKELQKSGNVYLSCLKVGIDKATHYRWKKKSKKYREESERLISIGRESNCDIAEHSLMRNVTGGKIESIKYYLSHNSERYKPKKSSVVIHKSISKILPINEKTLEDLIKEDEAEIDRANKLYHNQLKKEFKGKKLPLKTNGEIIEEKEFINYENYIRNWIRSNEKKNDNNEDQIISC